MKTIELYKKALSKWKTTSQMDMTIEECAELIQAIQKWKRSGSLNTRDHVLEEMADVEIMLEQMKLIFNYDFQLTSPASKFHRIKQAKLNRLEERLKNENIR